MNPESSITRAYWEAVIRVYAPWAELKIPPVEARRAAERVAQAREELAALDAFEGPADQTRWDMPPAVGPTGTYRDR